MLNTQEFVEEYFAATTDHDLERYLALFSDDVVVHDDGKTHEGLAAVRTWRREVPSVRCDVGQVTGTATALEATAEVSGDFPGSPVTLRFAFERDAQGKIILLDIAP